jgi:hypothetical protein
MKVSLFRIAATACPPSSTCDAQQLRIVPLTDGGERIQRSCDGSCL